MAPLKVVARERPEELSHFDLWNDPAWQRFGQVRALALGDDAFTGRLEFGTIGPISLCRVTAAAHRVEHDAETLGADGGGRLKVLIQAHGSSEFRQGGIVVSLDTGDFVIYDPAAAYAVDNPQAVEQVVMSVPSALLSPGRPLPAQMLGKRLTAGSGNARVALALLRTTIAELPHLDEESAGHAINAICRLLMIAVREQVGPAHTVPLKLVLRTRVRDFIEANLTDPELDVELIAKRLNCSKRYLHEVFDEAGLTIARYIWRRRLECSKDELVNPDRLPRPLGDIALAWGFSGLAHFSRAFKQEFGAAPSAFRLRAEAWQPRKARIVDGEHRVNTLATP